MKKKILGVTLIVTLAVVAAFNINLNKSNSKGDLALANVEALAQAEGTSYAKELEWISCPIYEVVVGFPIVIGGIEFPVGATVTYNGTEKACTFWLFSSCDQNQIQPCQKIK